LIATPGRMEHNLDALIKEHREPAGKGGRKNRRGFSYLTNRQQTIYLLV